MKTILILAFLICLSSCDDTPEAFHGEQCQVTLEKDLSLDKFIVSKCECRPYEVSLAKVGETAPAKISPIEKCNRLIGHRPTHYVHLVNLIMYVRDEIILSEENEDKN